PCERPLTRDVLQLEQLERDAGAARKIYDCLGARARRRRAQLRCDDREHGFLVRVGARAATFVRLYEAVLPPAHGCERRDDEHVQRDEVADHAQHASGTDRYPWPRTVLVLSGAPSSPSFLRKWEMRTSSERSSPAYSRL